MARILVTGDRGWNDRILADRIVRRLRKRYGQDLVVIHGDCRGIDQAFYGACWKHLVTVERFPADWDRYGNDAGPIRNRVMVATRPDFAIACHRSLLSSKGTRNCVRLCLNAGIRVFHIDSRDGKEREILEWKDYIRYREPRRSTSHAENAAHPHHEPRQQGASSGLHGLRGRHDPAQTGERG